MNNVLYESLPTEWNGYHINTGFHIGVQITLLLDDKTLNGRLKTEALLYLLFANDEGEIEDCPQTVEELEECIRFFLEGWSHDKTPDTKKNEKVMDFNIDQGRIFADFMQFYGIDLEYEEMHWWKFCWLLWNMPHERSSFLQVIEIRRKKVKANASAEERKAIKEAQNIYGLEQPEKVLTDEEKAKIDAYDEWMRTIKQKK
ncbi:MAG: hypothetical protein IJV29_06315 [Butyrivibrio sp.]|nr:hypothetical protein [Butyrivibrio sp.]